MNDTKVGAGSQSGLVKDDGSVNQAKLEENRRKDLENQLIMQEIQRKTTAQNTMMTAISTMQKGADDVLRTIANNLK